MAAIEPGKKAPAFTIALDDGGKFSLKDFAGKAVVLYFYPKDSTPGCTREALDFTAAQKKFAAAGAVVVGVSRDSVEKHRKFRDANKLKVILGSDDDGKVTEKYGVWVEKTLYGRKFMGIERSTFLIDATGVIRKVWRKVKVAGHADEVLAAVKAL